MIVFSTVLEIDVHPTLYNVQTQRTCFFKSFSAGYRSYSLCSLSKFNLSKIMEQKILLLSGRCWI